MENFQPQLELLQQQIAQVKKNETKDKLTLLVFSNSMDKLLLSLILASGAASMGTEVVLFFTFWGVSALRDKNKSAKGKDFISKMFGMMLPKGLTRVSLSNMNFAGAGPLLFNYVMKGKNVAALPEMLQTLRELNVKIIVCEMSMDLMGISRDELIDYDNLSYGGVATFLAESAESKNTLII